ncbi:MAG: carboxypeptidase [Halieaceae bacterium]|jgi:carboxypeptidase C (cathepsin A)|uniref:S10 family peptidase n=1 Tax=Haliea alexandrii TaxID=2448162 RepID=UPI000F0B16D7|nr:carboxypeptidase [Haliea alexandrii]MCR9187027.1 carboxypeptidase [Halieaceae bacterium]
MKLLLINRIALLLPLCLGAILLAQAVTAEENTASAPPEAAAIPEPLHAESRGRVRIDGKNIDYRATAGTLEMKNDDGDVIAHYGYTAYLQEGTDSRTRPLLFAYNGGPGSASMWLHMGILGPQRTVVDDTAFTTQGPFRYANNEYSILDRADLIMIDPVGTGFSRAVGKGKSEDFWGVSNDIHTVSDFIARYVTANGRWTSPKYLLGESYGGIRSGGVAWDLLSRHSIALDGVVLVSPYMDYVAGNAGTPNDLPYVNYLSTYAATAWYHGVSDYRPETVEEMVAEAERFAMEEYAPLLLQGHAASASARQNVLQGLQRFTGISADYWERANLRIDEARFAKELLRAKRKTVGRIDSRFVGDAINHVAEDFSYDPFFPAVGPAFVATFNDYYREVVGVKTDMTYVTSAGLWRNWKQEHTHPGPVGTQPVGNTAVDLAYAMTQNPHMRVLVQQGYYDLATPLGATRHFLQHIDLPEALRNNITEAYYKAGHMMYLHPPSMARFKDDLASFIR